MQKRFRIGITVVFAALLLAVAPAFAHTRPVSMLPAADATVDTAPTAIVIDNPGSVD